MLHFNKDPENIFLWRMLQNIYYYADKEDLALAHGILIGRACALLGYGKYSKEEVDRVLELASTIAQQRRKQIVNRDGGI